MAAKEQGIQRRYGLAREALHPEPPKTDEGPLDLNKDLPTWDIDELSDSQAVALARIKPDIRISLKDRLGTNLFFEAVPNNYSIENHRGQFSFNWLLWAADIVQLFPELRIYSIPGLGKKYSAFVFEQVRQSSQPDTNKAPFMLNLARYFKAFLEICPDKRAEIEASIRSSELHLSLEMYLNGEVEEQMSEFNLDPTSGWVQGFAASKVLFPDLAERINALFISHWSRMKEIIREMKQVGPDPEYVPAVAILSAESAWIDETGECHIELTRKQGLNPAKSLPERSTL